MQTTNRHMLRCQIAIQDYRGNILIIVIAALMEARVGWHSGSKNSLRGLQRIKKIEEYISLRKNKGKDKYAKEKKEKEASIIRKPKPKRQPNESSIHCFNLPERRMELVMDMTTNIQ
ncbi:hypothetical protein O181_020508 [Austropuccinia psidii MF-1]|uniref:Uncharacterized protein n=1 Tax=Austropuccinia psidii MF-1 TaxID=1389203 RepID=A0A9Q3CD25_9BASI|nr:hypothetical protein [Austropuccinia psidii MF-1]